MANEIRILEGDGDNNYQVLFLFPIGTPRQVNGVNVVPTPATTLSGMAATVAALPTMDVTAALNAGTMAYEIVSFRKDSAATNAQLIARLQAIYASKVVEAGRVYTLRYQHAGTVLNSV